MGCVVGGAGRGKLGEFPIRVYVSREIWGYFGDGYMFSHTKVVLINHVNCDSGLNKKV